MDHYQARGDTSSIAQEIQTGLLMIKQLEEFQKSSLETINQQIDFAAEQLQNAQKQLEEIALLATEASKDGDIKKNGSSKTV